MSKTVASILDGGESKKVQGWVDANTAWVVRNLVGTKGTSQSDVVATLLREWIDWKEEWLEKRGLGPPQINAGRVVIIPPGA